MTAPANLVGRTYGQLTVIKRAGVNSSRHSIWLCECECGNEVTVSNLKLKHTDNPSCGCVPSERGKRKCKYGTSDEAYAYARLSNQFMRLMK